MFFKLNNEWDQENGTLSFNKDIFIPASLSNELTDHNIRKDLKNKSQNKNFRNKKQEKIKHSKLLFNKQHISIPKTQTIFFKSNTTNTELKDTLHTNKTDDQYVHKSETFLQHSRKVKFPKLLENEEYYKNYSKYHTKPESHKRKAKEDISNLCAKKKKLSPNLKINKETLDYCKITNNDEDLSNVATIISKDEIKLNEKIKFVSKKHSKVKTKFDKQKLNETDQKPKIIISSLSNSNKSCNSKEGPPKNDNLQQLHSTNKVTSYIKANSAISEKSIKKECLNKLLNKKSKSLFSNTKLPSASKNVPKYLPSHLQKMYEDAVKRLEAGKFRFLNQNLASSPSDSTSYDAEDFMEYHRGFQEQSSKWKVNPIDAIIKLIRSKPLSLIIGDFGCGDAKIAQSFPNHQVHSFDLFPLNDKVTQCNIKNVPLGRDCLDIGIYCLSLMDIKINDYVLEANRVIKKKGTLIIAELANRFEKLNVFINNMKSYGFMLTRKRELEDMFVLLEFGKTKIIHRTNHLPDLMLLPFMYKKR